MPRKARPPSTQLALRLSPAPEPPLVTADQPTLLRALADLLLAALGPSPSAPGPATSSVIRESRDERQDHA